MPHHGSVAMLHAHAAHAAAIMQPFMALSSIQTTLALCLHLVVARRHIQLAWLLQALTTLVA